MYVWFSHHVSFIIFLAVPGKDPVITGIRSRYKVGDIVRGNCTSSHSRPAANITWTVNGYEVSERKICMKKRETNF